MIAGVLGRGAIMVNGGVLFCCFFGLLLCVLFCFVLLLKVDAEKGEWVQFA